MAIVQTGYSDAQSTNASSRSVKLYKDIALSFEKNSNTKDVIIKKDIEAVKQSVRNLILTNHYERPFHPEIGSDVRALLFENMTPLTALNLERKVQEVLVNFEPRAKVTSVGAEPNVDANSYHLQISFYVVGHPDPVTVETFLERLR